MVSNLIEGSSWIGSPLCVPLPSHSVLLLCEITGLSVPLFECIVACMHKISSPRGYFIHNC